MKTWACKIGEVDPSLVPRGGDFPMRRAVEKAYHDLTGEWPQFIFSGWGAELDQAERAVVEATGPDAEVVQFGEEHADA